MDSNDKTPEQQAKYFAQKCDPENITTEKQADIYLGFMRGYYAAKEYWSQSQSSEIERLTKENAELKEDYEILGNTYHKCRNLLGLNPGDDVFAACAEISSLKSQLKAKDKLLDETEVYLTKYIEAKAVDVESLKRKAINLWNMTKEGDRFDAVIDYVISEIKTGKSEAVIRELISALEWAQENTKPNEDYLHSDFFNILTNAIVEGKREIGEYPKL